MSDVERFTRQRMDADRRWQDLQALLEKLKTQRMVEQDPQRQLRLDQQIAETSRELEHVEGELRRIEGEHTRVEAERLVREALEHERKEAYDPAIGKWQRVLGLEQDRWDVPAEIQRLERLRESADQRRRLVSRLAARAKEIKRIYTELAQSLRDPGQEVDPLVEQFLAGTVDATTFVELWEAQHKASPAGSAGDVDFQALRKRLERGEIALFLGAEVANLFDAEQHNGQQIAASLARQVHLEPPERPLSAVAEYYQMRPEHGDRSLVQSLRDLLPGPQAENGLCQILARLGEPLLIVSASQDTLLENAFAASSKRYLVASAVVTPMPDLHPGQILLRYSDRSQPEEARLGEDLSRLSPLENGYSLIFKIRGECPSPRGLGHRDLSSLVLTERSLFAFARHVDKLIPSYVCRQLATRGFWFLGFEPRHWEDRLVAGAILEARRSLEPASVVGREGDKFETTYWTSRGVRRFPLALPDFVTRLGGGV